jgi:pimeloyl-ACP methyl ester carboxylesterase
MQPEHFIRANGNRLDYYDTYEGDALLIYHHGTPAAGPIDGEVLRAAKKYGFRVAELVRPGYINSTREVGRTVADVVPLTLELADHLGFEKFVVMGWSGGGPHALATGALAPERCTGVMSLAGVGPWGDPDLDFLDGMGEENLDEFGAALKGEAQLRALLEQALPNLQKLTGADVIDAMSTLLPEADRASLTGDYAEKTATTFRTAVSTGVNGWLDDDIAFVLPWGFEFDQLKQPLSIWQGLDDLMVPVAHGKYLASKFPHAELRLLEGHGHLSLGDVACDEGFALLAKTL